MDSKKHLPGRIVLLRVPFPGYACINVHVRTARKNAVYETSGVYNVIGKKSSLVHRPNILLRTLAFGFTQSEVLPLCPSRTNGNVGHKHKSQATQHGQNLSHIDAYNGEEKAHMEKETHM